MEALHRLLFHWRVVSISLLQKSLLTPSASAALLRDAKPPTITRCFSSTATAKAGWFAGLAGNKNLNLPNIVKAGEPVLHEPAREVDPNEMKSERVQKIIDDMIMVMRKAPGVGLAAPQIGIPLRVIVLEDTKEYIRYDTEEEIKAQDRRPFDLLVIMNPKLKKKSNRTALFFEGCLRCRNNL